MKNNSPYLSKNYFEDLNSTNKVNKSISLNVSSIQLRDPEIKDEQFNTIDSQFETYALPSFSDIYTKLSDDDKNSLTSKLSIVLYTLQQWTEKQAKMMTMYHNLESERTKYENEINKLNIKIKNDRAKMEKLEVNVKSDKKQYQDTLSTLRTEKDELKKQINKHISKENQLNNEITKKNNQISSQIEQIKKLTEINKSKSFVAINNEVYMSYVLNDNHKKIADNQQVLFYQNYTRQLEEKYKGIMQEHEIMKKIIIKINEQMIEMTRIKKDNFLNIFKSTYGHEYQNEKNIDFSVENNSNINENLNQYIQNLEILFVQFREFITRIDEIIQNSFVIPSDKNEGQKGTIMQKYCSNLKEVINYYKSLNEHWNNFIILENKEKVLKKSSEIIADKDQLITQSKELSDIAKEKIMKCIEENQQMDVNTKKEENQHGNIDNNEKLLSRNLGNINYDILTKEIENYTNFLDNMDKFLES